jgi:predicted nucleotidyltransferase component of viral defense system
VIELFHLIFLRVLASDRQNWFVLKGGVNLRYFFESVRYSNDIDLDFSGREPWRVEQTVDRVLGGNTLGILDRQAKLEILEVSKPKQTDTTRRWKIGLIADGYEDPIRTKIEFSARQGASDDFALEVVPDFVVRPYGLVAPTIQHYGQTAAIEQKIAALALRSETKARDVFDLEFLLRRYRSHSPVGPGVVSTHAAAAVARVQEITYASFLSEVVPFLDSDAAALYDEEAWEQMRSSVAGWIEELQERQKKGGTT